MKSLMVILISICFFTNASASISGGKRVYLEKLREPCGFTGDKMGLLYSKEEWRYFFKSKTLNLEIKRICPNSVLLVKKRDILNMYNFLTTFAKGSNSVPNCE